MGIQVGIQCDFLKQSHGLISSSHENQKLKPPTIQAPTKLTKSLISFTEPLENISTEITVFNFSRITSPQRCFVLAPFQPQGSHHQSTTKIWLKLAHRHPKEPGLSLSYGLMTSLVFVSIYLTSEMKEIASSSHQYITDALWDQQQWSQHRFREKPRVSSKTPLKQMSSICENLCVFQRRLMDTNSVPLGIIKNCM